MNGFDLLYHIPVRAAYHAAAWGRRHLTPEVLGEFVRRAASRDQPRPELVILDDVYPNPFGAWRAAEFHAYLNAFPTSEIHSDGEHLRAAGWKSTLSQAIRSHSRMHPRYRGRFRPFVPFGPFTAGGGYCLFLNGIRKFLPIFERQRIPFAFTLYPGGGFRLDEPGSDAALRRVFASQYFRGVIATQHVTRDYLVVKGLLPDSAVRLIWGAVMPPSEVDSTPHPRPTRPTVDVAFIAHKYMSRGEDKGYPTFVGVADRLAELFPEARFHVVGPFTPTDVPEGRSYDRFRFYGHLSADRLPDFFASIDLVLSPNVPFRLASGAFDGFPTGGVVQAGLAGAVMVCTDVLGENRYLSDGREILIVPTNTDDIVDKVRPLMADRDRLATIGAAGRLALRRLYAVDRQITPRVEFLKHVLNL